MNFLHLRSQLFLILSFVAACLAGGQLPVFGATNSVQVVDNNFSPRSVTNNAGDTVKWTWTGASSHSSTGSGASPLWDSGIHGNGFVFTHQFPTAGTFPYRCVVHATQTGTINVKAVSVNAPPAVSIISPAPGATFPAPWTGSLVISSSDSDGSVAKIDILAGSSLLGTIPNPAATATFIVTNLLAGGYTLTAVATDNAGAATTSAGLNITVVGPTPITISSALKPSANTFQFSYSASPGLSYVVSKSSDLMNWISLVTNTATGSSATFTDNSAGGASNFYRVELLPNP